MKSKIEIIDKDRSGIYKITNLANNKVYIGQSTNILKRFNAHKSRAFNPKNSQYESHLYRAIRKYGLDNLVIYPN